MTWWEWLLVSVAALAVIVVLAVLALWFLGLYQWGNQ